MNNRTVVVFGIRKIYQSNRNTYKDEAINLNLLADETEPEIIDRCVISEDAILWQPVIQRYLVNIHNNFLSLLNNSSTFERTIQKLSELINTFSPDKRALLIDIIPMKAKQHENIFPILSDLEKVNVILTLLDEPSYSECKINKLVNLLGGYLDSKWLSLISKIPIKAKEHDNIFCLLPTAEKIKIVLLQVEEPSNYEKAIDRLVEIWHGYSVSELTSLLSEIPIKAKQHDKIFSLLSFREKNYVIWELLAELSTYEIGVDKLAILIDKASEVDLRWMLSRIPIKVKQHDKIFPLLSTSERLKTLVGIWRYGAGNTIILSKLKKTISNIYIKKTALPISQLPDQVKSLPSYTYPQFIVPKIPLRPSYRYSDFLISTAASRSDAPQAEQIRGFVAKRKIKYLVHLTTLENLRGICQQDAILSIRQLQERPDHQYNQFDNDRLDQKIDHVCCSISYYNFQMFYEQVHKSRTSCVLLHIRPDYLWKQETLFCRFNAATDNGVHITQRLEGLEAMFANTVRDKKGLQTRDGKPDNLPTSIQAEVLVKAGIPLSDVMEVIIDSESKKREVVEGGWLGNNIRIASHCFDYRSGWINKENNMFY